MNHLPGITHAMEHVQAVPVLKTDGAVRAVLRVAPYAERIEMIGSVGTYTFAPVSELLPATDRHTPALVGGGEKTSGSNQHGEGNAQ